MLKTKWYRNLPFIMIGLCLGLSMSVTVVGQSSSPTTTPSAPRPGINYEVQLHLLLAANESSEKGSLPQSLDSIVRQLRASLVFSNYRLAATFLNRVKDGGALEVRGIIPSRAFTPGPATPGQPIFYEFTLSAVRLDTEAAEPVIQIPKLRFGLQVPIVTGMSHSEGSTASYPVINYNPVGITTEMSFREGAPTVIGTLNTNRPDEMLVLVVSVKRIP